MGGGWSWFRICLVLAVLNLPPGVRLYKLSARMWRTDCLEEVLRLIVNMCHILQPYHYHVVCHSVKCIDIGTVTQPHALNQRTKICCQHCRVCCLCFTPPICQRQTAILLLREAPGFWGYSPYVETCFSNEKVCPQDWCLQEVRCIAEQIFWIFKFKILTAHVTKESEIYCFKVQIPALNQVTAKCCWAK